MENKVITPGTKRDWVTSLIIVSIAIVATSIISSLLISAFVKFATNSTVFATTTLWLTLVGLIIYLYVESYNNIPVVHRGTYLRFGKRTDEYSDEGIAFTLPFIERIIIREIKEEVEACISDNEIITGDSVQMKVDCAVGFKIIDTKQSLEIDDTTRDNQLKNFVKSFLRKQAKKYSGPGQGSIGDWRAFLNANDELETALRDEFRNEEPRDSMAIKRWGIQIISIKITGIITTDPVMMKTAQAPARELVEREAEEIDTKTLIRNANLLAFGGDANLDKLVGISNKAVREAADMQQRNRNNIAPSKSTSEVFISWDEGRPPLSATGVPDPSTPITKGVVTGAQINKAIDNAEKKK
jgi:regulator of protease activity HflC (stomatin/prohibitin superfamily)